MRIPALQNFTTYSTIALAAIGFSVSTDETRREAWMVNHVNQNGRRKLKSFGKKKHADEFAATAHIEVGPIRHPTIKLRKKSPAPNRVKSAVPGHGE